MKKKEVILHVGLPKTGSTYLEECVFLHLDEVHQDHVNEALKTEFLSLGWNIKFKNHMFLDTEELKKDIDKYIDSIDKDKILFSDPNLFGSFCDNFRDLQNFSTALKKIFPDAKVLIVFRKLYIKYL